MALLLITNELDNGMIFPYYTFKCDTCAEEWSMDDDEVLYCPFCGEAITDREYVGDDRAD